MTTTTREPTKREVLLMKGRALFPWLSLATGIVGAVVMDRRPTRVWIVVVAAVIGWALVGGFAAIARIDPSRYAGRKAVVVKAAQFVALTATQNAVQVGFLFPLPFYLRAAALTPWHVVFLVALVAAAAIALWDPWYEWAAQRPLTSCLLQAFSVFAGTNAALPVLGLSNRVALTIAALAAGIGAPLFAWLTSPAPERRRRTIVAAVAAIIALPAALLLGGARLVPPAPLELVRAAVGTGVVDHEVVGATDRFDGGVANLICFTAIKAPLGLRDQLVHVWSRDGVVAQRVPLDVSGGRAEGFRTWSKKSAVPAGAWRCRVETASGQILGGTSFDVR